MELPARKHNRLSEYNYSTPNAYFLTLCTQQRRTILWSAEISPAHKQSIPLSKWGMLVQHSILEIPRHYPAISVDHYVIMPNHIHLLLQIHTDSDGQPLLAPTISRVIQHMKGTVTKQIGCSIWQKGFYDHVVRSNREYLEIWQYIEDNPIKWAEDHLYIPITGG